MLNTHGDHPPQYHDSSLSQRQHSDMAQAEYLLCFAIFTQDYIDKNDGTTDRYGLGHNVMLRLSGCSCHVVTVYAPAKGLDPPVRLAQTAASDLCR